ncbi:HlyD family secretion protein [Pseudoteredinibacter isoporae]|uniref:Membrane fusion protein (Multidrug efflux system) n=1 Tax=Pseudoteredinibacter isoporae TaxID=570281 RepID=A0A7X0JVV8_9GAMM|nr:HlyD family secretion protein [Pseudoteredinibacter isoporae]MBB6522445.1 membrane fusion protein (multidrug efflux system) [Pseudoteredinibacter isoporae]NHO87975.1 HlyD family secretion protein [Pseudoteredinibacter isoporae]NIB23694.1 HlyD family secretion protein [Pseudoteredinibacter isoporae]
MSDSNTFSRAKRPAMIAGLLIAIILVANWLYKRSYTIYLDDAHIASNIVSLSSRVPGWIVEMPASGGQTVSKDTLLIQMDSRQTELSLKTIELKIANQQLAIERARAKLQLVGSNVDNQYAASVAAVERSQATLKKAASVVTAAESNFERSKSMWQKKLISAQVWEDAQLEHSKSRHAYDEAEAQLHELESAMSQAKAALQEREIQTKTLGILERELELLHVEKHDTEIALSDRKIFSPLETAVIDKTFVHAGEFMPAGRRLLMLHDPNDIWIKANIKETQVRHVSVGDKAMVSVDAYPDRSFSAVVERIDHATSSQFALLPNPNPSGNFTKVTQRLSLRLAIEQQDDLLKPGMMVEVEIDTRDE